MNRATFPSLLVSFLLLALLIFAPPLASTVLATSPISEGNLPRLDEATLSSLDSYRLHLTFRYQARDASGQFYDEEVAITREIDNETGNQHLMFVSTNRIGGEEQTHGYYHVGQFSYVYADPKPTSFDNSCVAIVNEQEYAGYKQLFDPRIYLGSVSDGSLIRRGERVNGVKTDRYDVQQVRFGEFTSLDSTIWVAQTGNYVVRYSGEAKGTTQVFGATMTGKFAWDYRIEATNQLPSIKLSRACASQQIDLDLPIPHSATLQMNQAGIYGFISSDTPVTVANFYREALPANGWRIVAPSGPVVSSEGVNAWQFNITKGGSTYLITITPNTISRGSMIIITEPLASGSGQDNDVPRPTNATNINHEGNVTFFSTPDTPNAVASFYRQEMAERGWQQTANTVNGALIELSFANGNKTITIRITAHQTLGGSIVMIAE